MVDQPILITLRERAGRAWAWIIAGLLAMGGILLAVLRLQSRRQGAATERRKQQRETIRAEDRQAAERQEAGRVADQAARQRSDQAAAAHDAAREDLPRLSPEAERLLAKARRKRGDRP